jgi:hypothetical protein
MNKEMKNAYKILIRNLKERDRLGDVGVDGRIILQRILKKQVMRVWTGLIWLCHYGLFGTR